MDHALCIGHLLRELKYIEELTTYKWATKVKEILKESIHLISNRPNKRVLSKNEYKSLQSRYRNALSRGKKEMTSFQEKMGIVVELKNQKLKIYGLDYGNMKIQY